MFLVLYKCLSLTDEVQKAHDVAPPGLVGCRRGWHGNQLRRSNYKGVGEIKKLIFI